MKHVAANDDIMVQVDSDCDGFTSSAILINYLHNLFPYYVENHIFYRVHDGKEHGIIVSTIPSNIKLVIAPDSASSDYIQHHELKERGCDVLVIDHHEAEKYSEDAIVINNQLCDYPTKSLSGAGMVYKFCQYFDSFVKPSEKFSNNFLDLASIGIIGDVMSLKDFETRYIVSRGLENINNLFLQEVVRVQEYSISKGGGLCPFTVGFYIAPLINATIRSGTNDEKRLLFETMLDFLAEEIVPSTKRGAKGTFERKVEQVCRNCQNIRNRQAKQRDAEFENIEWVIKENQLDKNNILAVKLTNPNLNKNLVGLIANQILSEYQKPVLLLKPVEEDGKIYWEGSGRGIESIEMPSFKDFLNNSGLIEWASGHASAFGAKISDDNFKALIDYGNSKLSEAAFIQGYKIDFAWNKDFNPSDILNIAKYKLIWGKGLEEPKILFKKIVLTKENTLLLSPDKNPTLRINLSNGTSFIKFKSSYEEYEKLISSNTIVNIVGTCSQNEWNGSIKPQIIIDDYEIEGTVKYYF